MPVADNSTETTFVIPAGEVEIRAVRAQGAGGQNVNKVASAIHLRFDIRASTLSQAHKQRLLNLQDQRITKDGVVVIKAQGYRDQSKNAEDGLRRLQELISSVARPPKKRVPTRPTRGSQLKRLESKIKRGRLKILREKVEP